MINARSRQLITTVRVGERPWGIALSPDGKTLYAANGRSDDVSMIDLESKKEVGRIKVGGSPWGVEVGPAPKDKN